MHTHTRAHTHTHTHTYIRVYRTHPNALLSKNEWAHIFNFLLPLSALNNDTWKKQHKCIVVVGVNIITQVFGVIRNSDMIHLTYTHTHTAIKLISEACSGWAHHQLSIKHTSNPALYSIKHLWHGRVTLAAWANLTLVPVVSWDPPCYRVSQNAGVTLAVMGLPWDYLIPQYPQDRVSQNARLHRQPWDYRGICTVGGIPWVVLGGSPVTAKTPIRLQLNSAFVRPHDIFKSGSRCSLFNVILSKSQAIHFVGLTY